MLLSPATAGARHSLRGSDVAQRVRLGPLIHSPVSPPLKDLNTDIIIKPKHLPWVYCGFLQFLGVQDVVPGTVRLEYYLNMPAPQWSCQGKGTLSHGKGKGTLLLLFMGSPGKLTQLLGPATRQPPGAADGFLGLGPALAVALLGSGPADGKSLSASALQIK